VKIVEPPKIEYKGHKFRFNKKGDICRGLIIRQKYNIIRKDGSVVLFNNNNTILIKKKQNPKSKFLIGPTTLTLKRKKFKSIFEKLV
jgi:ribosomal protein L14